MFKSDIFNTQVQPTFTENDELNLTVRLKSSRYMENKIFETVHIEALPYRETVIAIALIDVTIYTESQKIEKKIKEYESLRFICDKNGVKKKKRLSQEETEFILKLKQQIMNKQKKIHILNQINEIALEKKQKLEVENLFKNFDDLVLV